jgi:hypothetical protein
VSIVKAECVLERDCESWGYCPLFLEGNRSVFVTYRTDSSSERSPQ